MIPQATSGDRDVSVFGQMISTFALNSGRSILLRLSCAIVSFHGAKRGYLRLYPPTNRHRGRYCSWAFWVWIRAMIFDIKRVIPIMYVKLGVSRL